MLIRMLLFSALFLFLVSCSTLSKNIGHNLGDKNKKYPFKEREFASTDADSSVPLSCVPLSCHKLNYKDYIQSYKKTQELIAETGKGCNLKGADLRGIDLRGGATIAFDLTGANPTADPTAYLIGADLTGAILTEANLTGVDLTGADLTGADLTEANLWVANLTGAILKGAYLKDAYLKGAYLTKADLTEAYFRGADLTGTNLKWADFSGAYLTGAKLNTHGPLGNPILRRSTKYDGKTEFPEGFDPVELEMRKASKIRQQK